MNADHMRASALRASALLKAMGNPHRLMVLCLLLPGEKSVGELERMVGLSQSALSQHLARLRRDRLVKTRRVAQTIYYSLSGREASTVLATLYSLYCADQVESEADGISHVNAAADDQPVEPATLP